MGRDSGDVIMTIEALVNHGIHVRTSDGIDTTTATGKAMLGMFAVFAQMEHDLALSALARPSITSAQGITGGRPRSVDAKQAKLIQRMHD